jgi:hypothetical protein
MSSQRSSTDKDLANRFPTTPDCAAAAEIDGFEQPAPPPGFPGCFQQGLTSSRLRMSGNELVWRFVKLLGELGDAQNVRAASAGSQNIHEGTRCWVRVKSGSRTRAAPGSSLDAAK